MSWLRPCTANEEACAGYVAEGSYVIVYCARLATREALTEGVMRGALWALYRKVPTLRVCLKKNAKDGKMWIKNVEEDAIDFEVLEDADVEAAWHEQQKWQFPADAPLWGARLLPWAERQRPYVLATSLPDLGEPADAAVKEVETKHHISGDTERPFVSHLLLVFHHSITDGYSCLKILKTLLQLIDDVIEGRPTDETTQVACLIDSKHEEEKQLELERKMQADASIVERRNREADELFVDPMIYRKVPLPPNVEHETIALQLIVNRSTNRKFLDMCKRNKITYHTGFMALLDAAYVKTLQDLGIFEDRYPISSQHCVNLRQYFKDCANSVGNCMNLMDTNFNTPANVVHEFWTYAQVVSKAFREKYTNMEPLMSDVVEKLSGKPAYQTLDVEKLKKIGMEKAYTYSTTNMLDVTKVLINRGKHVRLTFYDRITSVQCVPCLWTSVFQTFHGHLVHSLQYNAHLVDRALAQHISDNIAQVMKEVSE